MPAGGVQRERRLERGHLELVDPHRSRERVPAEPADQIGAADDAPRLWTAEQLVAAARDEVGAVGERLVHGGLLAGEPALGVEQPGPDVEQQRHAGLPRDRGELGRWRRPR